MSTLNDLLIRLGLLKAGAPAPAPVPAPQPVPVPAVRATVAAPTGSAQVSTPAPLASLGLSSGTTTAMRPNPTYVPPKPIIPPAVSAVASKVAQKAAPAITGAAKDLVSQVMPAPVQALVPERAKVKAAEALAPLIGQTAAAPVKAATQFAISPGVSKNLLGVTRERPEAPIVPQSDIGKMLFGEEIKPYTTAVREEAGKFGADPGIMTGLGLAGASIGPILDLFPGIGPDDAGRIAASKLPKALAGAKPLYNFGTKKIIPAFASDVDKAAFILAQGKRSKKDAEYLKWAMEATGLDEGAIRQYGTRVKESLKGLAKASEEGGEISVPSLLDELKLKKPPVGAAEAVDGAVPGPVSAEATAAPASPARTPSPRKAPKAFREAPGETPKDPAISVLPPKAKDAYGQELPQKEIFFNWDRLDISPEAKKLGQQELNKLRAQIEAKVGTPLTNKEVLKRVEEMGSVRVKAIGKEETVAEIANELKIRQKIAKMAEEGKVDEEYIRLKMADYEYKADAGRKLQALRTVASPKEQQAIDLLLDGIYKSGANAEEVIKAAQGVDLNDPEQAAAFYRKFVKPKMEDWLDVIRYNSMLSSPITHLTNVTSNAFMSGPVAAVEKTLTGTLDAARAMLTGTDRKAFAGEGLAHMAGYAKALPKAAAEFWDVLRGKGFMGTPDVRQIPLATSRAGKAVEGTLKAPMRALEAMDRFFVAMTKGGIENSLGYRAKKLGKPIEDFEAEALREANKRLFRGELFDKDQGHVLNLFDNITHAIEGARNHEYAPFRIAAKFTLPFIRTPMNIVKQTVEYSPLGVLTLPGAANKTEQLSKAIMGSAAAAGVATLAGQGRLTWGEPTDAEQKAAWRAAGIQPYSVKVGDKWYSYQRLPPPLAANFALVSSIQSAMDEKGLDDATADSILAGASKWWQFMSDQAYAKSVGDFVAGTKGDVERMTRIGGNYSAQLIPFRALMSWANNLIDTTQRLPKSDKKGLEKAIDEQMQWIMTQLPGLSKLVEPRVDSRGAPISKPDPLFNLFSPVKRSTEDPVKAGQVREGEALKKELIPLKEEAKQMKADADAEVRALYEDLRTLPPEEANAKAEALDDATYSKLKAYKATLDKKEASTPATDALAALGVDNGLRSRKVWEILGKLATPEEKNAKVEELRAAGLVTKDVEDQLYARKALEELDKLKTNEEKQAFADGLDDATYEALAKIIKAERKNTQK